MKRIMPFAVTALTTVALLAGTSPIAQALHPVQPHPWEHRVHLAARS